MASIQLDDLHFHFESPYSALFEGLTLTIDTDWRTALVGRNGRGKTTLLRLVHGELSPSRSAVKVPARTLLFPFEGRERLGRYLATKGGYLLVSHDRHFLDLCCDHVLSINKSDVQLAGGGYSEWREHVARVEENERLREANLKREIRGLEASARRRRGWSGLKEKEKIGAFDKGRIGKLAARVMKRALATERQREEKVEEKRALLENAEKERKVRLRAEKSPERVLEVEGATVGYHGRAVVRDVSFRLERGQRLAIVGPNGCGKSTLLKAIAGELPLLAGSVHLPGHLDVARGHQEPPWCTGHLRDLLREGGVDETLFRTTMAGLGVCGEIFDRPLETFSMGELKKVDLTRSFLRPHHLLLWDEPMNYIDLDSREDIEEVLLREQPTMLFVEHDRWFVEHIATAVLDLGQG